MKSYRDTMENLRFSPEDKAAMVQALLPPAAAPSKPSRRKKTALLVAAAAAAVLCAACATGLLQDTLAALATRFGDSPDQIQTMQTLTQPVQASATDNGVTISVEAVIRDTDHIYLLSRMTREDGQPVLPQTEEIKNVSNGDNTLQFKTDTLEGTYHEADSDTSTDLNATTMAEFLAFEAHDKSLYFLHDLSFLHDWIPTGPIELTLENLYSHERYSTNTPSSVTETQTVDREIPLVEGTWTIPFSLDPDHAEPPLSLGSGQTFRSEVRLNHPVASHPFEGTIQTICLSPMAFYLAYDYTVDPATLEALAQKYSPDCQLSLDQWIAEELSFLMMEQKLSLTFTDGTQVPLSSLGSVSGEFSPDNRHTYTVQFKNIIPPDTIASITIGDLTIPVLHK